MHPYLIHSGHLVLPTFGALAALGLMLAITLSERTARLVGIEPEALWNAGVLAVVSAFILSRLLLIGANLQTFRAFPILLLAVPSLTPTGLALTALAALVFLRRRNVPVLPALDAWAPCATLVWLALALGHFFEGSDPGLPTPHGLRMPGESTPLHPVALYAAVIAALLTAILYRYLTRRPRPAGRTAALAFCATGLAQFLLSFVRQPGAPAPLGLDTLQWVALALLFIGLIFSVFAERIPKPAPQPATP